VPYPHWLAKAYDEDGSFIDVIFNSGNGGAPVDDEWFVHAVRGRIFGVHVDICPVEETIWSKAFVMERERFDGADVLHLLLARARGLDWSRLLRRFGDDWPVLLSHILLFGYAFPDAAQKIPRSVVDDLSRRWAHKQAPTGDHLCRGTLLSREQYLPDISCGWHDARLRPAGSMSAAEIETWTKAIANP
jgi:hypothetical protein